MSYPCVGFPLSVKPMLYISAPSLYLTNFFLSTFFTINSSNHCTALSANKQTEYTSPHLLADKNCNTGGSSLHRPHRSCTVISLTGLRFPRNPEVSLSQICFIAPCNCYIFCPISLAPYLCFNVLFQHFLTFHPVKRQGRYVMAHLLSGSAYPHVLYAIQYSIFKVHRCKSVSYGKGQLTALYTASNASIFVISFVSSLRRSVSSTQ